MDQECDIQQDAPQGTAKLYFITELSLNIVENRVSLKKLLLHTCCADCLVKTQVNLRKEGHSKDEILVYFDNSNIHPRSEWLARLGAVKKMVEEKELELIVENWSPKEWFEAIEHNSDNTDLKRCRKCWKFRLERAERKRKELRIQRFSTTLLTSRYQDWEEIVEIGKRLARCKRPDHFEKSRSRNV